MTIKWHTSDRPAALYGRDTEHLMQNDIKKKNYSKAASSLFSPKG